MTSQCGTGDVHTRARLASAGVLSPHFSSPLTCRHFALRCCRMDLPEDHLFMIAPFDMLSFLLPDIFRHAQTRRITVDYGFQISMSASTAPLPSAIFAHCSDCLITYFPRLPAMPLLLLPCLSDAITSASRFFERPFI